MLSKIFHPRQGLETQAIINQGSSNNVGLHVDQAGLSWLQQPQRGFFSAFPSIHPLVFLRVLIQQVQANSTPKLKLLVKQSYKFRSIPTQHINDHYFTRSLKFLSAEQQLSISGDRQANAGDIVVFAESTSFIRIHWALCGSGGRLYHVHRDGQRITCSFFQHQDLVKHIINIGAFDV